MSGSKKTNKKSPAKKTSVPKKTPAAKTTRPKAADRKELQEKLEERTQKFSVLLFAVAILFTAIIFVQGESVWLSVHNFVLGLFGACAIACPLLLFYIAIVTAMKKLGGKLHTKIILVALTVVMISTTIYCFKVSSLPSDVTYFEMLSDLYRRGAEKESLGLISGILGYPFVKLLGAVGSKIFVLLALFVTVMFLTGTTLVGLFKAVKKPVDIVAENIEQNRVIKQQAKADLLASDIDIPLGGKRTARTDIPIPAAENFEVKKSDSSDKLERLLKAKELLSGDTANAEEKEEPLEIISDFSVSDMKPEAPAAEYNSAPEAPVVKEPVKIIKRKKMPDSEILKETEKVEEMISNEQEEEIEYALPPSSMLEYSQIQDPRLDDNEKKTVAQNLVNTLKSFGIQTTIIGISKGPTVTRYELQPAAGVKISKITNLADDLALNLAASGVRIEAPIPGKAAVGIEVPNKTKATVRMREMIESPSFTGAKSKLTVTLGKDIAGQYVFADLAKMPHLLIAGTTGSGKSVCVNSFILSILYKASPDEVKMIMIDPKMVELPVYNGIPHLLIPVVTDPKKAAGALNWAVGEMMKRYQTFAETNVRDIEGYNKLVDSGSLVDLEGRRRARMSQIVIVIDELADLMMVAHNEVEDSICRIAQLARAAGIHLVVATQRPSVDVITGLIKANVPSRIALTVASNTDSRTILDSGGAEKLLGNGDMLFAPVGSVKPKRVQGCYVSDEERESVINFVKQGFENNVYDEKITKEIENCAAAAVSGKSSSASADDGDPDSDPMLEEAIELAVDSGQISTSALQRRFRLGYARAGRIVDTMEQMGIVGPSEGSKPRKVLLTKTQWLERNMMKSDGGDE